MTEASVTIRPQAGPQWDFASCTADIGIYGGAAFGGKTWSLLVEAVRPLQRAAFDAVIFRRTYPQITNSGGLWDASMEIYTHLGGKPKAGDLSWEFPSGHCVNFRHLQHEKDKLQWQGSAVPLLGFDELTQFSKGQFFYLLSRNRMYAGAPGRPYVRATCNPDPDSWVTEFISWWIDQGTGQAIPERAGAMRWMCRDGDRIVWGDSAQELLNQGLEGPKSVTFIPARATDNRLGLERDPGYLSNLKSLPLVEREQLLNGNWKIRACAGSYFRREWFGDPLPPHAIPKDYDDEVRYWDRAATVPSAQNPSPDGTSGLRVLRKGTQYFVTDEVWMQGTPGDVQRKIKETAILDDKRSSKGRCTVCLEEDPGQAGKADVATLIAALAGHRVETRRVTTKKSVRAGPVSTQVQHGNVKVGQGAWLSDFLQEIELFPEGIHDDRVDSLSGAFNYLTENMNSLTKGKF